MSARCRYHLFSDQAHHSTSRGTDHPLDVLPNRELTDYDSLCGCSDFDAAFEASSGTVAVCYDGELLSFLLPCPNCGKRSVYEFQFGGEVRPRPPAEASREAWTSYIYWRDNSPSVQKEWWYHKLGCKLWFVAERNTTSNQILASYFAEPPPDSPGAKS